MSNKITTQKQQRMTISYQNKTLPEYFNFSTIHKRTFTGFFANVRFFEIIVLFFWFYFTLKQTKKQGFL